MQSKRLALIFLMTFEFAFSVAQAGLAEKFQFSGTLYSASNATLVDSAVAMHIEILDPNEDCVLYVEDQNISTMVTNGNFSIWVGEGSWPSPNPGNSLSQVMANGTALNALNAAGRTCVSGAYYPSPAAMRKMKVTITPSSTNVTETLSPSFSVGPAGAALVAERLSDGSRSSDLLHIDSGNGITQANLISVFSQLPTLTALLNGSSSLYMKAGANGAQLPSYSSAPASPTAGAMWYNSTSQQLEYYNGTTTQSLGGGGAGTVTSITTGTGLTGGPITTSGVIAADVGTTANKLLQLDGSARIPAVDGSQLTNLTVSQFNAGTLSTSRGGTGSSSFSANRLVWTGGTGNALADYSCSMNNVVSFDGSGAPQCSSVSALIGYSPANPTDVVHKIGDTMTGQLNLGGYPLAGSTTSGGNLTLDSTSQATKGAILLNPTDGSVGIGTTSPIAKLHVQGASPISLVKGTNASGWAGLELNNDISNVLRLTLFGSSTGLTKYGLSTNSLAVLETNVASNLAIGTQSSGNLVFGTNGTERMRISNAGNVGIGTLSPASNLEVVGTIRSTALSLWDGSQSTDIKTSPTGGLIMGQGAGGSSPSGVALILIGKNAGYSNTGGQNNTVLGYQAEYSVTTGSYNTAIGAGALYSATVGSSNNTALGYGAGSNLSNGNGNVFIGTEAGPTTGTSLNSTLWLGKVNSTGLPLLYGDLTNGKVGLGTTSPNSSLQVRSTANTENAIEVSIAGSSAADNAAQSSFNLVTSSSGGAALGQSGVKGWQLTGFSDYYSTTPLQNVLQLNYVNNAVYKNAVTYLPNGNVGFGTSTPMASIHLQRADSSTYASSSGTFSTPVGLNSPAFHIENTQNINGSAAYIQLTTHNGSSMPASSYIGNVSTTSSWNSDMVFGFQATSNTYNERMRLTSSGNVGIGTTTPTYQLQLSTDSAAKPGTSTWTIASDERLKDIRAPFTRGLGDLLGLNTVYFNYKQDNPLGLPSDKEFVGIKAQDAQKVIPEAVSKDKDGYLHVTNDPIIWTAINAIKEIYIKFLSHDERISTQARQIASKADEREIDALKAEIRSRDQKINELERRLDEIEKALISK